MTSGAQNSLSDLLVLRPVVLPQDDEFLRKLYIESRSDLAEMAIPVDLKRDLLMIQYRSRTNSYAEQFPAASHDIVEIDGHAIGRIMVDRRPDSIHIVDISLLPERRDSGVGTWLLQRVMDECSQKNLPCSLQVLISNRARRLYERLGFQVEDSDGIRLSMRWIS